jgi:predicted N-formylglutamate amidohydrolase
MCALCQEEPMPDPSPFRWINRAGGAPVLILCDHASNAIPTALGDLGLDQAALEDHIAWDVGAAQVAEGLAHHFEAPAILSGYSRLVIDCNRYPDEANAIPAVSDGVAVPGNVDLTPEDVAWRQDTVFWPYHREIEATLAQFSEADQVPVVISVHSFTPVYGGARRPWDVAICWRDDDRMSAPVLEALSREPALTVGDNEPYSLDPADDYSLIEYGLAQGLAHLLVEIRNDGLVDGAGVARWTERLARAIEPAMANPAARQRRPRS